MAKDLKQKKSRVEIIRELRQVNKQNCCSDKDFVPTPFGCLVFDKEEIVYGADDRDALAWFEEQVILMQK